MSEENVEIMRGILSEMARGNFWALAPEKHRRIVGDKVFHGPSGVEAATREWFEAWDFYEAEAEEILDAGDSVVVLSRARGRSKYGGVAVEARSGEIWTLRGGKVVRFTGYDTRAEALKAAGLSE